MQQKQYGIFSLPVIVGSLGFFVDIYDLLLFGFVQDVAHGSEPPPGGHRRQRLSSHAVVAGFQVSPGKGLGVH